MIEETTTYAYKLKYIENVSFNRIRAFAQSFVNELPQELVDDIYEQLNRGLDLLQNEPQMLVYLYSFGNMHQAKLNRAFEQLPDAFLQQPEIRIVDYGCGQAIGTMCYADFLADHGLSQTIKSVTLIEPSEICLKRAALHAKAFFPDAEIRTVCKGFDDLNADDILSDESTPTLHILSNVLDILDFDLERFAKLIDGQLCGYNQFVCVGPYFNYSDKDERMSRFAELLNANTTFAKMLDKYELNNEKAWTCQTLICSIGELVYDELSTLTTDREIESGIEDEGMLLGPILGIGLGVIYSKDGKRLLKCRNSNLTSYEVKEKTKVICNKAFYANNCLKQISIPDSIINIGHSVFFGCKSLQKIYVYVDTTEKIKKLLPKELWGIIYISTEATEERISDGIKDEYGVIYSRDGKMLLKCENVDIICYEIKVGTKVICDTAFSFCKSLRQITIPNTVTNIGDNPFVGCRNITIKSETHRFVVEKGLLIDNQNKNIISQIENNENVIIPDSVNSIGKRAFWYCDSLRQVIITNSVTSIGDEAFSECISLQHIIISNSVISIGKETFYQCVSLQQISIPNTVTIIGDNTFEQCISMKQIILPDSITSIGDYAFSRCESLRQITIPDSVIYIGDGAFDECNSLQQITIPDSVMSIGNHVFYCCPSLQKIIIPIGSEEKFKRMIPDAFWYLFCHINETE